MTHRNRTEDVAILSRIPKSLEPGGLSPGEQFKQLQRLKAIINPLSSDARKLLNTKYGVPLPLIRERHSADEQTQFKPRPKFKSLATDLSKAVVKNHHKPPPISEQDAKQGMLHLIERKFIPNSRQDEIVTAVCVKTGPGQLPAMQPYAVMVLDPAPVQTKQAMLYSIASEGAATDKSTTSENVDDKSSRALVPVKKDKRDNALIQRNRAKIQDDNKLVNRINTANNTMVFDTSTGKSLQGIAPCSTPVIDGRPTHRFVIQNGQTRVSSQDFRAFKSYYESSWGSIVSLLKRLEKLTTDYSIPVAIVDGDSFVDLALYFEGDTRPSAEDLLTCVLNADDLAKVMMIPGRRYLAPDGTEQAAIKIQTSFRRYKDRSAYLAYRKQKWAAGLIALQWIMSCKMTLIKRQLRQAREGYLERFKHRMKMFRQNWTKLKTGPRVIIHIPSLGYDQKVRDHLPDIKDRESRQIGRIFDISDSNIEIIYVCPYKTSEDTKQYYLKLIGMVNSNSKGSSIAERCTFVVPDALGRFPGHKMCLSTTLKYSTRTLNRIKSLIKGKNAYIVPGVMHIDDLYISDFLDIPVLGSEPEVARLYATKSGARRIFDKAEVDYGPGETDIYNISELHENLARLVAENLGVRRWLFKIDEEMDGRGIAYCEVTSHLNCYNWVFKEAERYGEKWNKKWAREAAYLKILAELPEILERHAVPADKKRYSSWREFLHDFLGRGGIIEACPPSESTTNLTAEVLIEPNATVTILSAADQIQGLNPYLCLGYTFPQLSVEMSQLQTTVESIAESCKARGVIGYVSMAFVTFIDPHTMHQRLWPVGLNLSYSECYGMVQLLCHLSEGRFISTENCFQVPITYREELSPYKRQRRKTPVTPLERHGEEKRFAVMTTRLHHSNLKSIQSNVLFQLCKSHGIGYDVKAKLGTVFSVIDQMNNGCLGMVVYGKSMQEALSSFALNLSLINKDISSDGKHTVNNFQAITKTIQNILDISGANLQSDWVPDIASPGRQDKTETNEEKEDITEEKRDQEDETNNKTDQQPLKRLPCPSPVSENISPH